MKYRLISKLIVCNKLKLAHKNVSYVLMQYCFHEICKGFSDFCIDKKLIEKAHV